MKNEKVCNNLYSADELIPIVARLADKFTSKESTSITYERARSLMEAVIYCINQFLKDEDKEAIVTKTKIPPQKAYEIGYQMVIEKVKRTQEQYNELTKRFCSFKNENYRDTVEKALPAFFLHYNPLFEPAENIITMDYPVFHFPNDLSGINAIALYVDAIDKEQRFLFAFPEEYVLETLQTYDAAYKKQFFNICHIVLQRTLLNMLIGKRIGSSFDGDEYEKLKETVMEYKKGELKKRLEELLRVLIDREYGADLELFSYLSADLWDLEAELFHGAMYQCLENMVVL